MQIKGRYEIKATLGQGGMGVVYRAYDTVMRREVALKTIRDAPQKMALDLFYKECNVLASMSHPNIIEIFDVGDFEEEGVLKPYFVMPLLPGVTLDQLIRTSSQRLEVARAVDIICQACRGLQAAHDRGLVHRDLKPSNIFVLDDDSVKIIDFGVAHIVETHTMSGPKGTLLYMAPEQIQLKPASALSDMFAMGVVAYESLTRRRPFDASSEIEAAHAILHRIPPPVSELNPAVNQSISRVIHKAMAKHSWHRFATAREFADALQKAYRNEPLEMFDPSRLQPRIERATKAFERGDHQFASEVVAEMEAEGYLDPAISLLRRQIDNVVRQKTLQQLLESARTRLEDEEYPLALQKIQEALEIDPDNAEALRLRHSIEGERKQRQVDDWLRLASQHIERFAYAHAREAVQNALQLRPTDSRALELQAEIQRREGDYLRLREEKEKLYQAALQAYDKAELSTALSRLERVLELDQRAPEASSTERGTTYQTLYNQVRSEHDNMMGAYNEARRRLADGDFARARELCGEFLNKYPGQALFQALRFDIEEQRRQALSSYIAQIDTLVEAEPNLDRRVDILREASHRYPDEPHFERTLRLTSDKRELVNSIVAKARGLEEKGQYNEALAQWEILRTIYSQYPGLAFEVERVMKRRDQQARGEAKARAVEQIDRHLETGEYVRALSLIRTAQAEFPDDDELAHLGTLANQGMERTEQARKLLEEGQDLCRQKRTGEGLALLRQAHDLEARDPLVRAVLLDTLLEYARGAVESDWRQADALVEEALALNPESPVAKSLRILTADRRREELVDQATARARQLQASGDVAGALAQVDEGLREYPAELRLKQLRTTLLKSAGGEALRTEARRNDVEELKRLQAMTAGPAESRSALARVREIAQQYPDDQEIQGLAAQAQLRGADAPAGPLTSAITSPAGGPVPADQTATIALPGQGSPVAEAPPTVVPQLPGMAAPPAPPVSPAAPLPAAEAPPAPPVSSAAPPAKVPAPSPRPSRPLPRWIWAAAAGVVVLAAAGLLLPKLLRRRVPPPPGVFRVEIRTSPPGATILINKQTRGTSNLSLDLPPGTYEVNAVKAGYRTGTAELQVGANLPGAIDLTLPPLPPVLRLFTDLEPAKVLLDEQPAGELQGGQLILDNLPPGRHTLKVTGATGEATLTFETAPGALPQLASPATVREVAAVVVGNQGPQARIYSSLASAKLDWDGKPAGEVGPNGLELSGVAPGDHELAFGEGKDHRKLVVEISPAAALTVFVSTDRDVGTLVVTAGEDEAAVFINGKQQRRLTRGGQLRIANLPAGKEYTVSVKKPGFLDAAEQRVRIQKGEDSRIAFTLRPAPTVGALAIEGGLNGTEVLVDGNSVGTVDTTGALAASNIKPGDRVIELRNPQFKSRTLHRNFVAGETVRLGAADVKLESAMGTLRINVTPPGSTITVTRSGESSGRTVTEPSLTLPEGTYVVTARANGFADGTATAQVRAGGSQTVEIALARVSGRVPPPKPQAPLEGWEKPEEWKSEQGWYVHRGGDFVLFRAKPPAGTFIFSLMLQRGKRLRWVANYIDDRNYVLFEMDDKNFYRKLVTNGKTEELVKTPHQLPKDKFLTATLEIKIQPHSILQRLTVKGNWTKLDEWTAPGQDFTRGRFGLLIRGRDQFALSNFSFERGQ